MHFTAETQRGIVGFLKGKSILSATPLDPIEFSLMHGIHNSGTAIESVKPEILKTNQELLNKNGLPSCCVSCSAYKREVEEIIDHRSCSLEVRSCISCVLGGCNEARKQFLLNMAEIEKKGGKKIKLNERPNPLHVSEFGEMIEDLPKEKQKLLEKEAKQSKEELQEIAELLDLGLTLSVTQDKPLSDDGATW